MYDHPGGKTIFVKNANGQDATDEFEAFGHSKGARNKLPKYYIGELEGHKKAKQTESNFLAI